MPVMECTKLWSLVLMLQFLVYVSWERLNFGLAWGICQILKFYLAVSCTTKSTVVHSFSIQCPRTVSSIISSLLQHHYHAVFWSLRPSLKLSKSLTLQHISGFWWQKHQTMAFVQGSGIATLSPLNYISVKESSRPNHKDRWLRLQRCNCFIVRWWLTRCLTAYF